METETKTDNELIAEFMGLERSKDVWEKNEHAYTMKFSSVWNKWVIPSHMKFHTSWDWLMPAVEKIDQLYHAAFPSNEEFIRRILSKEEPLDGPYMDVIALPLATPINEVYKAVLEFIKWYNNQKATI